MSLSWQLSGLKMGALAQIAGVTMVATIGFSVQSFGSFGARSTGAAETRSQNQVPFVTGSYPANAAVETAGNVVLNIAPERAPNLAAFDLQPAARQGGIASIGIAGPAYLPYADDMTFASAVNGRNLALHFDPPGMIATPGADGIGNGGSPTRGGSVATAGGAVALISDSAAAPTTSGLTRAASPAADTNTTLIADPVPEPGEWALLLAGLGLVVARRRRGDTQAGEDSGVDASPV